WVVFALLGSAGIAHADEKPTLEDVKKAWKARQEANKSFRIEWAETVKWKAGAYDGFIADRDNPGPHPPKDHEYPALCSFAVDGDKVATTDERSSYFLNGKTWNPSMQACRFDRKAGMMIDPLARPGWGDVRIEKGTTGATKFSISTIANEAVRRIYRPLGGGLFPAFELEKAKLTDRTEKIQNIECVEIVGKNTVQPAFTYSLWCDPDRGFLPIREKREYGTGSTYLFEWEYRRDDKKRWVPSGWEYKRLEVDGTATQTVKAEVKKLELDHKFADDAFAPKPPPFSRVVVFEDGDTKEEYLLRPDGSKRSLKPSERAKDFNEVIKTNADGTPYVPPKK
ncbi:MAG: hypothetical protein L0241_22470, partial [Planctomycetia bacterium]|nr:hypothetical protein [Planctomycetia bacterium]